jgi:hypothetical protein
MGSGKEDGSLMRGGGKKWREEKRSRESSGWEREGRLGS